MAAWQRVSNRPVSARATAIGVATATCLGAFTLAPPAAVAAASLCAPPTDTVAPQLADVMVSPTTIDLNSGPRTITVTATATDTSGNGAPSGVRNVYVFLEGRRVGAARIRLNRTGGDPANGTYTGTWTLPKYAGPGTLSILQAFVTDHAGNSNAYTNYSTTPSGPNSIALQSGWQPSVTVTGTPPSRPAKKPAGKLASFAFAPTAVNATVHAKRVLVTATFHGRQPQRVYTYFQAVNGRRSLPFSGRLKEQSDKTWAGHVRVGRWIGRHTYRPALFAYFGNQSTPSHRSYEPTALHTTFLAGKLTVTSGTDDSRPTLRGLTITPSSVDTTAGAQSVDISATAVDAQSGISRVQISFYTRSGNASGGAAAGLYPYPGIGYTRYGGVNVTLHHTTGNTWTGTGTFQECVPNGKWHIDIDAFNHARLGMFYNPGRLAKAGLPNSIQVLSTPGDVVPPYVYSATASGQHQTITLDFSEGVKNVSTSTLAVYAMRPVATRYQHTTTVTGIVCSNGTSTVNCDGSEGLITSADLAVPDLSGKVGAKYAVYANLDSITSQLTDGIGNPMDWNNAATTVTDS